MIRNTLPLVFLLVISQAFSQTVPVTLHFDTRNTSIKDVWLSAPSYGYDNVRYTDEDNDSIKEITANVPIGYFGYLPLPDNAYMWDSPNPKDRNSYIEPPENDTTLTPVCFETHKTYQQSIPEYPFRKGVGFSLAFESGISPYDIRFNYYSKQDFLDVKSLGIDEVRLPIFLANMIQANGKLSPLFLYLLDEYVDMAEETGVNLILTNMSPYDYANVEGLRTQFLNIWTQMAEHFKNRSTLVHYELANEPSGISDEDWGRIQGDVIDAIRQIDNTHTIIVTPANWGSLFNLKYLPYYEDSNLIYVFHFYDPFLFTHQGAESQGFEELIDVPFPYDAERMPPMPTSFIGSWNEWRYYDYSKDGTAEAIEALIDTAATFMNERNVRLWCGEFGVVGGASHDDKVTWYRVLRSSLEENGIAWSMHGYTRFSGPFEYGTDNLFNYDLDIPLVEALGLNIPAQEELVIEPDTSTFVIYDDYVNRAIDVWISADDTLSHFYSENDPKEGKFCVQMKDFPLWCMFNFNFIPNRDFSTLVSEGYCLSFWIKGDTPGARFNVRFFDTDTDDPNDHPWRMVHDIDESLAAWDGEWHHVQILLSDFDEQGAAEGDEWYNPEGKFDWSAIDNFQIQTEYQGLEGTSFWFDDIKIIKADVKEIAVTFQVNMKGIDVSHGGVSVVGNWSNWQEATQLSLVKDDIYAGTIVFETAGELQWRFANTTDVSDYDNYEYLGTECTKNYNRYLSIPESDTVLTPVCFNTCNICDYNKAITFQIDMQNEEVSASGVFLAGSFNDWNTTALQLTSDGTVYSATVELTSGTTVEYKFLNGEIWEDGITGDCTVGNYDDRQLVVPNEDQVLDAVCFNSCSVCNASEEKVNVTFRVDMQNETISPDGVFLGGDWNSWYTWVDEKVQMEANGSIYTATVELPVGLSMIYKFGNGDQWEEEIPDDCSVGENNDRQLTVPETDVTLDVVCFDGCAACGPVVVSDSVDVTFRVDMQNETISSSGVHINGSFCNWAPADAANLQLFSGGTVYAATLRLKKGETVEYKFVNGAADDWAKYEDITGLACAFGNDDNRGFVVPDNDVTLDVVCFDGCAACGPVVVSDSVDVTFRVDMQNETISSSGVHLNGSFCNWAPADAASMQLFSGGTVYATTLRLKKGETIEYKFVNGAADVWAKYEDITGLACAFGNDDNRGFVVPDNDVTLDVVCFGGCAACSAETNYTITTSANTSTGGTISGAGTYEEGTLVKISAEANFGYEFVNWTCADTVYSAQSVLVFNLFNDLNLVAHFIAVVSERYTITTSATPAGTGTVTGAGTYDAGTVVTITATPKDGYAFVNWTVKGVEVSTSASYTFTIDKTAAYLAHFTKASELVNVSFQVDMQNEEVSSSGIYLNGSFCSWDPSNAVQLTANGSVYSTNLTLPIGETIEYKFVNGAADDWAKYENLTGLACAFGNDDNRGLTVPDNNITLDVVCFGKCSYCEVSAPSFASKSISIFPNPTKGIVEITGLPVENESIIEVVNLNGAIVQTLKVTKEKVSINMTHQKKGLYFLRIKYEGIQQTFKVIRN